MFAKLVLIPPRFPIHEAPDDAAKKVIEDTLPIIHHGPAPFKWVEDDGTSLIGCYAPLSCTTGHWTQQFFELAKLCYSPMGAKPRSRELAILGLCSIVNAPYMVYCHRAIGTKLGLTAEQYDEGLAGQVPRDLNEEESMA
ncbi:hypothetical protein BDV95DRAFT_612980 [Massariosphaeria phaeospora]|uniref:Carboxymuconolactone decarboxylase-like domain-containing protein n=1 Tax=Massariosphaeria phaeospora TaxID=100035 RepID=A0A7C8HYF6_9PLEO|nr:hypothetical protein BDV95DRAFT_612980 [Massariosphaeria phaeospora]